MTSRDEIATQVIKDVNRFIDSLVREDPLGALIRGHLFVESKLIQLISLSLSDPGAIELSRLAFPMKLDLAVAMGLLTESDKRGYAKLNALRNQVAHNIDAQLTESEAKSLYHALNEKQRKDADGFEAFTNVPLGLLRSSIGSLCSEILSHVVYLEQSKTRKNDQPANL